LISEFSVNDPLQGIAQAIHEIASGTCEETGPWYCFDCANRNGF